jgi:hypothetical protein
MLYLRCFGGLNAIPTALIVSKIAGKPALTASAKRYASSSRKSGPANTLQNLHISPRTLSTDDISIILYFQTISSTLHSLKSNHRRLRRDIRSPTEDINTSGIGSNTNPVRTQKYIQS